MKARSSQPTVALVNPLWIGHHPMYFSQFTAAFLRAGAFVIGLCPEPVAARDHAIQTIAGDVDAAEHRISMHHLRGGRRSWFGTRFEGDPLTTFERWVHASRALFEAERACARRADLVFFPHLDSYVRFLPVPWIPEMLIDRPWSGLYLRNHHYARECDSIPAKLRMLAKGDALCRSRLCREIGVLDERFSRSMEAYLGKPVVDYPDATLTSLPANQDPLVTRIRTAAGERKIIGLIGLERRKGLVHMLQVARKARLEKLPWFFVCAGAFHRDLYPAEELAFIDSVTRDIAAGVVDNVHFDPAAGRIPDETSFNALFSAFDVAWIAYQDFQGSSGALSKAAAFDIPSIATAGECVGARVERFRTGLTIPQADCARATEAIRLLLDGKDWDGNPLQPRFADFRAAHSLDRLNQIAARLLSPV